MMRRMIICLMALIGVLTMSAQTSVYDFKVKDDAGKEVSLSDYKGKVLKRYEPTDKMSDIEADIQNELQQN